MTDSISPRKIITLLTFILLLSSKETIQFEANYLSNYPSSEIQNIPHMPFVTQSRKEYDKEDKGETLIITTKDGSLHALRKIGEAKWEQLWSNNFGGTLQTNYSIQSSLENDVPFIPNENIILRNEKGVLTSTGITVKEFVEASPFIKDDFIFMGTKASSLYFVDISSGKIIKKINNDIKDNSLNEHCYTDECQNNKYDNEQLMKVMRIDYHLNCLKNDKLMWKSSFSELLIEKQHKFNFAARTIFNDEFINKNILANEIISSQKTGLKKEDIMSVHHISEEDSHPIKIYDKIKNAEELLIDYQKNFICENPNERFNKYLPGPSILEEIKSKAKIKEETMKEIREKFESQKEYSMEDFFILPQIIKKILNYLFIICFPSIAILIFLWKHIFRKNILDTSSSNKKEEENEVKEP
ncbi:MAG: hypothetical protein MJ252_12865, partial [archaeon]|nr:hypothetical protein [archaeon]